MAKRQKQLGGGTTVGSTGARGVSVPDHQVIVALKIMAAVLMYGQGEKLLRDQDAGEWAGTGGMDGQGVDFMCCCSGETS